MAKLQPLFGAIASARDEWELRLAFMDNVGEYFGVQRWGISLFKDQSGLATVDVYGVSDSFVENYQKIGREVDPLLHYIVERHAPVHEELVLPAGGWKQCEYRRCCSQYDQAHIMTGPIVGDGRLVGTVNFARVSGTPAFDANDVADLSAVCTHFSAKLATLRTQPKTRDSIYRVSTANRLTPREIQIVELVAQGMTNAQIAAQLWITENSVKQALKRIFRKLDVSTRAQMVAQLQNVHRLL